MQSSQAYVRRLLISRRLYGVKVGPVWAIYPEDLESFQRLRRRPGRPQGTGIGAQDEAEMRVRINSERDSAGTARALRQRPRKQMEASEQA